MLALLALDQGRVDRGLEGGIVELDRDVLGARVLGRLAPARAELDAVGGDPVVGGLVVVLGDGLDGRLDVDVEGADRAGEAPSSPRVKLPISAIVVSPDCSSSRPMRPRWLSSGDGTADLHP